MQGDYNDDYSAFQKKKMKLSSDEEEEQYYIPPQIIDKKQGSISMAKQQLIPLPPKEKQPLQQFKEKSIQQQLKEKQPQQQPKEKSIAHPSCSQRQKQIADKKEYQFDRVPHYISPKGKNARFLNHGNKRPFPQGQSVRTLSNMKPRQLKSCRNRQEMYSQNEEREINSTRNSIWNSNNHNLREEILYPYAQKSTNFRRQEEDHYEQEWNGERQPYFHDDFQEASTDENQQVRSFKVNKKWQIQESDEEMEQQDTQASLPLKQLNQVPEAEEGGIASIWEYNSSEEQKQNHPEGQASNFIKRGRGRRSKSLVQPNNSSEAGEKKLKEYPGDQEYIDVQKWWNQLDELYIQENCKDYLSQLIQKRKQQLVHEQLSQQPNQKQLQEQKQLIKEEQESLSIIDNISSYYCRVKDELKDDIAPMKVSNYMTVLFYNEKVNEITKQFIPHGVIAVYQVQQQELSPILKSDSQEHNQWPFYSQTEPQTSNSQFEEVMNQTQVYSGQVEKYSSILRCQIQNSIQSQFHDTYELQPKLEEEDYNLNVKRKSQNYFEPSLTKNLKTMNERSDGSFNSSCSRWMQDENFSKVMSYSNLKLKKIISLDVNSLRNTLLQNSITLAFKANPELLQQLETSLNCKQEEKQRLSEIDIQIGTLQLLQQEQKVDSQLNNLFQRVSNSTNNIFNTNISQLVKKSNSIQDILRWNTVVKQLQIGFSDRRQYDVLTYFGYDIKDKLPIYLSRSDTLSSSSPSYLQQQQQQQLQQQQQQQQQQFEAEQNYNCYSSSEWKYPRPLKSYNYSLQYPKSEDYDNNKDEDESQEDDENEERQNVSESKMKKRKKKKLIETDCSICFNLINNESNRVVYCSNCDISFHQNCYGLSIIPETKFICDSCEYISSFNILNNNQPHIQFPINVTVDTSYSTLVYYWKQKCILCSETLLPVIQIGQLFYHPTCLYLHNFAIYKHSKILFRHKRGFQHLIDKVCNQRGITCSVCLTNRGLKIRCSQLINNHNNKQALQKCSCWVHPLCGYISGMEVWAEELTEDIGQFGVSFDRSGDKVRYPGIKVGFKCKEHADRVDRNYDEQSYYRKYQINYRGICSIASYSEYEAKMIELRQQENAEWKSIFSANHYINPSKIIQHSEENNKQLLLNKSSSKDLNDIIDVGQFLKESNVEQLKQLYCRHPGMRKFLPVGWDYFLDESKEESNLKKKRRKKRERKSLMELHLEEQKQKLINQRESNSLKMSQYYQDPEACQQLYPNSKQKESPAEKDSSDFIEFSGEEILQESDESSSDLNLKSKQNKISMSNANTNDNSYDGSKRSHRRRKIEDDSDDQAKSAINKQKGLSQIEQEEWEEEEELAELPRKKRKYHRKVEIVKSIKKDKDHQNNHSSSIKKQEILTERRQLVKTKHQPRQENESEEDEKLNKPHTIIEKKEEEHPSQVQKKRRGRKKRSEIANGEKSKNQMEEEGEEIFYNYSPQAQTQPQKDKQACSTQFISETYHHSPQDYQKDKLNESEYGKSFSENSQQNQLTNCNNDSSERKVKTRKQRKKSPKMAYSSEVIEQLQQEPKNNIFPPLQQNNSISEEEQLYFSPERQEEKGYSFLEPQRFSEQNKSQIQPPKFIQFSDNINQQQIINSLNQKYITYSQISPLNYNQFYNQHQLLNVNAMMQNGGSTSSTSNLVQAQQRFLGTQQI